MPRASTNTVAVTLAVGIVLALLVMTAIVFYAVIHQEMQSQRLIAVTQVLTGWGGGIISLLSAYIGYAFGVRATKYPDNSDTDTGPTGKLTN